MFNIQSTLQQSGTPGTLSSSNLYINPSIPRNSQAQGLQGTDNRGYTRTVGSGELVENRLNRLLGDPNSAYVNQARSDARLQAQSRGLGNSSIAAGAGVRAAIQSALPIASQDAQTMSAAQAQNLDAMNNNLMQERDIQNRMLEGQLDRDVTTSGQSAQLAAAMADMENRLRMQRENLAYQGEQAGLGRAHSLTEMERAFGFDIGRMGADYNWRNQFADADLDRDLTRMGADYSFRDQFASNDTARQNWLNDQNFNRGFYGDMMGALVGTMLNNSSSFFEMLNSNALNNPDVFNAEDYTNWSNFGNQAMSSTIANIFAQLFGGGAPGAPAGPSGG